MAPLRAFLALGFLIGSFNAQQIINGQIFTPGIAIVNAPQPNTPLGGDTLHVSLDVTYDGQLQLPPYPSGFRSGIYNITIFLSSYDTGRNFTVTNGTATANNSALGDIMLQEKGSTVKHVNWIWPDCLVGNGPPTKSDSDRGKYNISIRQNFRLNGSNQYNIFDLPIQVINSISESSSRSPCDSLNNPLLTEEELRKSASNFSRLAGTAIAKKGVAASFVDIRTGALFAWIGLFGLFLVI